MTIDERAEREKSYFDSEEGQAQYRGSYRENMKHERHYAKALFRRIVFESTKNYETGSWLELGSSWWASVLPPNNIHPRSLTCINISEKEIEEGKKSEGKSGLKPDYLLMDAHKLDFPEKFDVIFGGAILHHLELEVALKSIHGALKDDGVAFFVEPLAMNPIAALVRWLTPQARTVDEQPFRLREIALLERDFSCNFYATTFFSVPVQFLSRILFESPENPLMRSTFALDQLLCRYIPGAWLFYRDFIVVMKKK